MYRQTYGKLSFSLILFNPTIFLVRFSEQNVFFLSLKSYELACKKNCIHKCSYLEYSHKISNILVKELNSWEKNHSLNVYEEDQKNINYEEIASSRSPTSKFACGYKTLVLI